MTANLSDSLTGNEATPPRGVGDLRAAAPSPHVTPAEIAPGPESGGPTASPGHVHARCGATTKRGRVCRWDRELCPETGRCYRHCQCAKHTQARKANGSIGGKNSKRWRLKYTWPLDGDPQSPEDIKRIASWAMRALDEKLAVKVRSLCDVWLKANTQGTLAEELREIRARLDRHRSSQP